MASPNEILSYWFGQPEETPAFLKSRGRLWFGGGDALDREIEAKFGSAVRAAADGQLNSWRANPDSCLALIILLDQFALNIFRNQSRGYELSERAIPLAITAIDAGFHFSLHPLQKSFFYLPLEHAEDMSLQEKSVSLFRELENECRGTFWAEWATSGREWADRHLKVVKEFGRFPHRNQALGRESTQVEIAFLKKGQPF